MKILIGYDGSAEAKAMLKDLASAGLPARAEALVLQVVVPWVEYGDGDASENGIGNWPSRAARNQYNGMLEEYLAAARISAEKAGKVLADLFPGWRIHAEAVLDRAANGILAKADSWKPDLIVVGAHGRSAIGRLLLGSVSEKVLHYAKTHIRIARKGKRNRGPVRILLGLDGSRGSLLALKEVAARKWPKGTLVRVMSVIDHRDLEGLLLAVGREKPSQSPEKETSAWLTRISNDAVRKLTSRGLIVTRSIQSGDARRALLEEARKWNANCIFLGSRGLTGVERFLLGSVSSAVATHSKCPVEIVRA